MTEFPIKLGLNRPQYVANPDLLLVSLAHRSYELKVPAGHALVFRNLRSKQKVGKLTYRETSPLPKFGPNDNEFAVWVDTLGWCGVDTDSPVVLEEVGRALAGSMVSATADKALSVNALPMTPATALLQDPSGMLATASPPNFGLILEQLHALASGSVGTVTGAWHRAALTRVTVDPLARVIESATSRSLLSPFSPELRTVEVYGKPDLGNQSEGSLGRRIRDWSEELADSPGFGTPMVWFARNWGRLTSEDWVEALPARRWVDWASAVLRHAFAFGFLWEAHFFRGLAELVLDADTAISVDKVKRCANSWKALLKWRDSDLSASARSLSIKRDVVLGLRAMRFFESQKYAAGTELIVALETIRQDADLRKALQEELASRQVFSKDENTWEAIRYALLIRQESGTFADHYGLFRANRNWLYPDPGAEWIVVMGSLCAGVGGRTTAGVLLAELNALGIDVSLPELLRLVEASGLAELAADADQAVIIDSAF